MPDASQAVTIELLEKYSIVRSNSGTWQEAKAATNSLQQGLNNDTPYPDMERDRDRVVGYAETLTRSSRALAAAILLTADLQRYSASAPGTARAEAAVKALSEGLQLTLITGEDQRIAEITACAAELLGHPDLPAIDGANPGKSIDAWKTRVRTLLDEVHSNRTQDKSDLESAGWHAWDTRLAEFARKREAKPDLSYLRCLAMGLAPGTVLPPRLIGPSIACSTSEALVTAIAITTTWPMSFALGLAEALGFDISKDLVREKLSTDEQTKFLQKRGNLATTAALTGKGLLVLRQVSGSRTAQWQIMPGVPVIVLPLSQWRSLFGGRWDMRGYLSDRLAGVLFESDGQEDVKTSANRFVDELKQMRDYLRSVQGGVMFPRNVDQTKLPAELQRAVIAPQNQAEALKAFQTT
jgi:hypothetical protein